MTPNPDAGNDGLADRLEKEPLADELFRLIDEWNDAPFESSEREEAWNLIADCVTEAPNAKAILAALRASDTNAREVQVAIWSGEHCAYWRANGAGYTTDIRSIGSYSYADAVAHTKHCGPEKMIEIIPWPSATTPPPPLRRAVGEEEAGER